MKSAERKKKFEEGLAHFNSEKFFEAHEFWEEIWLVEPEPEKTFLQGLIQITAAYHHHQRGNPDGAQSLLTSGIVKLLRFPDDHLGLPIKALRETAKAWVRALGEQGETSNLRFPRLSNTKRKSTRKKTTTHPRG